MECAENLSRSPNITRATGERPSQKKRTNEKAGLYVVESPPPKRAHVASLWRLCGSAALVRRESKTPKFQNPFTSKSDNDTPLVAPVLSCDS